MDVVGLARNCATVVRGDGTTITCVSLLSAEPTMTAAAFELIHFAASPLQQAYDVYQNIAHYQSAKPVALHSIYVAVHAEATTLR